MKKKYIWRILSRISILSIVFIFVGLILQNIAQPLDTIRWLLYRWGYPYLQSIALSILLVTLAIVRPDIANNKKVPLLLGQLLTILINNYPKQNNKNMQRILLGLSTILLIASISFPRCFSSSEVLISFDIWNDNILIANVSSGEVFSTKPGISIEIEAKLEADLFNSAAPQKFCTWTTYTGDGKLLGSTNCKINYRTGLDGKPDPISVKIIQKGCVSSLGNQSFFVKNSP
jgi:hypothetical protein